jgi:Protein of unknown function (DUF2752)
MALAGWLEPDARGFGTHTQLGLQPCAFTRVTGRLCPTCGMTTAFAWFVRGKVDRSWQANPAGFLLALAMVPLIGWMFCCVIADQSIGFESLTGPLIAVLAVVVVGSLGFWLIRLIVSPTALVQPWSITRAPARSAGK